MGELVQLFKPKCQCGWPYPHHVRLDGVIPNPFDRLRLTLTCPKCGETIEYNEPGSNPLDRCIKCQQPKPDGTGFPLPAGWHHHSLPSERREMWPDLCEVCGQKFPGVGHGG